MNIVGWIVMLVAIAFLESSVLKELLLEPALAVCVSETEVMRG